MDHIREFDPCLVVVIRGPNNAYIDEDLSFSYEIFFHRRTYPV